MAKLPRVTQVGYGDSAPAAGNFGVFGSLAAGAPQYSKNLATIQSLDGFRFGLNGAVVGNKSPAMEDINSLFFLAFEQIRYLLQQGIPEWDASTAYYVNQFVSSSGKLYKSKTDDNLNNAVSNTNHWSPLLPSFTADNQSLWPDMITLVNTGSGQSTYQPLDLTSYINSAGLNQPGIQVTAAILRLQSQLGPAGFAQYTGSCSMQAWGNNTAANPLSTFVLIRANDSDAAGADSIYGMVPMTLGHGNTIFWKLLVSGTAAGLNGKLQLAGFTYRQTYNL